MTDTPSVRNALADDFRWLLVWMILILVLTSAPYLYAHWQAPEGMRFGGMLTNPLDGNSYLAKMAQGRAGQWTFHLSYTSEPHDGVPTYLYYLLLGHLARVSGLSLIAMFHLARVVNGLLLMCVGYVFAASFLEERRVRRLAWLFMFLSSGLGWLFALFGHLAPDLYVPEAIPFYAIHNNPHFPLAGAALLALLLAVLAPWDGSSGRPREVHRLAIASLASVVIAATQPFLFLHAGLVIIPFLALRWRRGGIFPRREFVRGATAALLAAPLALLQARALSANAAMRGWTAQNVTLSPPPWDYALAFAVLLPLATWGAIIAARRRSGGDLLLILWATVNLLLPYAPLNLQRRLAVGLQFPLALLAAHGVIRGLLPRLSTRWGGRVIATLVGVSFTSNLFLLALGAGAAAGLDPLLYLLPGEEAALRWLAEQPHDGAVLALPRTSMLVPAWSDKPVYYGHPMESLDAERKEAEVETLFGGTEGDATNDELLHHADLAWLWVGPYERERASAAFLEMLADLPIAYDQHGVTIYRLAGDRAGEATGEMPEGSQ